VLALTGAQVARLFEYLQDRGWGARRPQSKSWSVLEKMTGEQFLEHVRDFEDQMGNGDERHPYFDVYHEKHHVTYFFHLGNDTYEVISMRQDVFDWMKAVKA